jgi:hypothetical protein
MLVLACWIGLGVAVSAGWNIFHYGALKVNVPLPLFFAIIGIGQCIGLLAPRGGRES